jgi:hypothetical protein
MRTNIGVYFKTGPQNYFFPTASKSTLGSQEPVAPSAGSRTAGARSEAFDLLPVSGLETHRAAPDSFIHLVGGWRVN